MILSSLLFVASFAASYGQHHKAEIFLSPYAGIGNTYQFYGQFRSEGDLSGIGIFDLMGAETSPAHVTGLQAEVRFSNRVGLALGGEVNYMQFWGDIFGHGVALPFRQTWFHLAFPLTASWYQPVGKQGYRLRFEAGTELSIYTNIWSGTGTARKNQALQIHYERQKTLNQGLRLGTGLNLPLSGGSDLDISALLLWGLLKPIDTQIDFYRRDQDYTFEDFLRIPDSERLYSYSYRLRPVQMLLTLRYNFNVSQLFRKWKK